MTIYDRIKERRKSLGMSQQELADASGYKSRSAINKIEKGSRDINQTRIKAIATALKTTPAFLMGLEDQNKNNSSNLIEITDLLCLDNVYPLPKFKKVPILGTIACGHPILAEENIEEFALLDESVNAHFALRCKGNSMINARIFDGDIVYIRQQPDVENGEIAAVLINNEATLKKVYKYPNRIELRPENPTCEVHEYEGKEINKVKILGKAIAFLSAVRHQ